MAVCVRVYLQRPQRTKDRAPIRKPDVDKVAARSVLDALSGIVYTDDARVTHLTVAKEYASRDVPVGARISWEAL